MTVVGRLECRLSSLKQFAALVGKPNIKSKMLKLIFTKYPYSPGLSKMRSDMRQTSGGRHITFTTCFRPHHK